MVLHLLKVIIFPKGLITQIKLEEHLLKHMYLKQKTCYIPMVILSSEGLTVIFDCKSKMRLISEMEGLKLVDD